MARAQLTILTTGLMALSLAACATAPGGGRASVASNPTLDTHAATPLDRYRPAVETALDQIALAPHPAGRLSDAQKLALTGVAQRIADQGDTQLAVSIAASDSPAGDAGLTARAALDFLANAGVPTARLSISRYETSEPQAPVRISFRTVAAVAPDCRKGWDNFAATGSNRTTEHFGCATAANLAAMISDPRDLMRPAAETASDATRRGVVLGKYSKGDTTSANKDEQASGAVSQAVK